MNQFEDPHIGFVHIVVDKSFMYDIGCKNYSIFTALIKISRGLDSKKTKKTSDCNDTAFSITDLFINYSSVHDLNPWLLFYPATDFSGQSLSSTRSQCL